MTRTRRTYGGWRPRRGYGLGGLSEAQTVLVAAAVLVPMGVWIITTSLGLGFTPVGIALVADLVVLPLALIPAPGQGVSIGAALVGWLRFHRAHRAGQTQWSSGVLTTHPRGRELPGVLAPLMPITAQDGLGRDYGLLWHRRTGQLTTALRLAPVGTVLADTERSELWVANFDRWLASLGHEPTLDWVAVTIESAPAAGTQMADYVSRTLDPDAPAIAREMLTDIAKHQGGSVAETTTRVSLTFTPERARPAPRDDAEKVAVVSRILGGLSHDLPQAGAPVLGKASAADFTHWIRAAFDPAVRPGIARASERQELLAWADAAPVAAAEEVDHYQHDTGWSVSWALAGLPTRPVTADALAPLLVPGRYLRRVTVTYQPFPADRAREIVRREATGAEFRHTYRRRRGIREDAAERADAARAAQAEIEQAQGAGVVLYAMYVTTTVTDPRDLPDAVADVISRAASCEIRLRPCNRWQAAGFAAGLGVGIYPPSIINRGRWLR